MRRRFAARIRTKKIIARLNYEPKKHKQKITKELRRKLASREVKAPNDGGHMELKIGAMNVNGLDWEASAAISTLVSKHRLDIFAISETFGREDQPDLIPELRGYSHWAAERKGGDKGNGGLCVYYRPHLNPHIWKPQVSENLKYLDKERQWVLISRGKEKLALLHCYLACETSRNNGFIQWNEDLYFMMNQEIIQLRQQGFMVISIGDYNAHIGKVPGLEGNHSDVNNNGRMFMNFITQSNLVILNTLPIAKGLFTRFMCNRGRVVGESILDYGLVDADHVDYVSSFVIDSDARYECGSDHALLTVNVAFQHTPTIDWKYNDAVRFNLSEKTDYGPFKHRLDQACQLQPLHIFEKLPLEEKLAFITSSIIGAGQDTLGFKVSRKKKPFQLPLSLRRMIQEKNEIAKKLRNGVLNSDIQNTMELKLVQMEHEIKTAFAEIKLRKRNKIRTRILRDDPQRKKFWRFIKSHTRSVGEMTGMKNKAGEMVFDQASIEETVLQHFSDIFKAQRVPLFHVQDETSNAMRVVDNIDQILRNHEYTFKEDEFERQVCSEFTMTELGQVLSTLPDEKSSGVDGVPNELLKHSGDIFRMYLLTFLNQILADGRVPEQLNTGKCILIHKVRKDIFIFNSLI